MYSLLEEIGPEVKAQKKLFPDIFALFHDILFHTVRRRRRMVPICNSAVHAPVQPLTTAGITGDCLNSIISNNNSNRSSSNIPTAYLQLQGLMAAHTTLASMAVSSLWAPLPPTVLFPTWLQHRQPRATTSCLPAPAITSRAAPGRASWKTPPFWGLRTPSCLESLTTVAYHCRRGTRSPSSGTGTSVDT